MAPLVVKIDSRLKQKIAAAAAAEHRSVAPYVRHTLATKLEATEASR